MPPKKKKPKAKTRPGQQLETLCREAKASTAVLACLPPTQKNRALLNIAQELRHSQKKILQANHKDVQKFRAKNPSKAMLDRLMLNPERLEKMARGLEALADLPDPVGKVVQKWETRAGLKIQKVQIPLGVIGFIYEARPNVTTDAAGLCLKSGNAVILRGGSEAFQSNLEITACIKKALAASHIPESAVQFIPTTDRAAVDRLLRLDELIDLIIPRGGEALIRHVARLSRIPVLKHYKGVCHLYIDESASPEMAEKICVNAKVQRPGVCNAIETLLVHRSHEGRLLPRLIHALQDKGVEIRAPKELAQKYAGLKIAKDSDFGQEFLDLILALRTVGSVDEAIAHIQRYGSNHTESIITQNKENADKFLKTLQSSVVLVNASTRLADGGEMGMGAEIGISTTKLHAYGPMGLDDLTVGHYLIEGQGQIRS